MNEICSKRRTIILETKTVQPETMFRTAYCSAVPDEIEDATTETAIGPQGDQKIKSDGAGVQ